MTVVFTRSSEGLLGVDVHEVGGLTVTGVSSSHLDGLERLRDEDGRPQGAQVLACKLARPDERRLLDNRKRLEAELKSWRERVREIAAEELGGQGVEAAVESLLNAKYQSDGGELGAVA